MNKNDFNPVSSETYGPVYIINGMTQLQYFLAHLDEVTSPGMWVVRPAKNKSVGDLTGLATILRKNAGKLQQRKQAFILGGWWLAWGGKHAKHDWQTICLESSRIVWALSQANLAHEIADITQSKKVFEVVRPFNARLCAYGNPLGLTDYPIVEIPEGARVSIDRVSHGYRRQFATDKVRFHYDPWRKWAEYWNQGQERVYPLRTLEIQKAKVRFFCDLE